MKALLYITTILTLLSCSEQEPSIYGRYQVNRIVDGVVDTLHFNIWQLDSNYFSNYKVDSTLASAQIYFIKNDTIVFGNAYEDENTGKILFDTTQWYMTFSAGANGIDTLEDGFGKFHCIKIGPPINPYNDTTEIQDAAEIKKALSGSWASYTNVLRKKHNEKFRYIRYEFKGNQLRVTHFNGNSNMDPDTTKATYFIVGEDKMVTIPEKVAFQIGFPIRGNKMYRERELKFDITDSVLFIQFDKSGKGIELIKE